jgi:MFS family permease
LGFGSLQLVSNNLIAQWFIRRRGRVMGLAGLSLPIGLMIFPGLSQFWIDHFGWRWTMGLLGLLVWLVMLPVSLLFFKTGRNCTACSRMAIPPLPPRSRGGAEGVNATGLWPKRGVPAFSGCSAPA